MPNTTNLQIRNILSTEISDQRRLNVAKRRDGCASINCMHGASRWSSPALRPHWTTCERARRHRAKVIYGRGFARRNIGLPVRFRFHKHANVRNTQLSSSPEMSLNRNWIEADFIWNSEIAKFEGPKKQLKLVQTMFGDEILCLTSFDRRH